MLQLRTFGGLSLARGSENLTGAVTQRRRLAILALLAAAGDVGVSRDKLVAYLWPESGAERARHVLNQLLYAQRRQVGADALFLGRKTLRLNPAAIWTDVAAFERWCDSQRTQYARRVIAAIERLARRAADQGDHRQAVGWWQRAETLDGYDSGIALALVRVLVAAGDRAGAMIAARRHEELLRRDLGVAPDPAFMEAVARLH